MKEFKVCKPLFSTPMIRYNGDVVPCSMDLGGKLILGNINNKSISDIWYSNHMKQFRINHIKNLNLPEICEKCPKSDCLTEDELRLYIRSENLKFLYPYVLNKMDKKLKVILINPPVSERAPYKSVVSLGLGYVASAIRDISEVVIVDMVKNHFSMDDMISYIGKKDFHIIGITGMTYQGKNGIKLGRLLREKFGEKIIISGGVFATARSAEVLLSGGTDLVILKEGEEIFRNFILRVKNGENWKNLEGISYIEDGKVVKNRLINKPDVMKFPVPARDIMVDRGFILNDPVFGDVSCELICSRGCPGVCIFCESPRHFGTKVRARSIDSIVEEIRDILALYGVRNFAIDDDSFSFDKERILEFCNRLLKENLGISYRINTRVNLVDEELLIALKNSGCVKVSYGIESGSDEILKVLGKKFTIVDVKRALKLNKKVGLPAAMLFIVGNPLETKESIDASLMLIKECKPEGGYDFQVMQPHPGTALGDTLYKKYGRIITKNWDDYYSDNITFIPNGFEDEEFLRLARDVTKRDIQLAGRYLKKIERKSNISIEINPENYSNGYFDLMGPHWWEGDESYKEGLAHILGKKRGFIEYRFDLPPNFNKKLNLITISLRLSSQIPQRKSEIILLLNEIKIGELLVPEKSSSGELFKIKYRIRKLNLLKNNNILRLEVKKGKYESGITIFGPSLSFTTAGIAQNILIEFDYKWWLKVI